MKPLFAPIPARAIADASLSSLDIRVLAAIAYRDRFSLSNGKGQGCWAGNKKLAQDCKCHPSSMSESITRLTVRGYIDRETHPFNRRINVYRVVYDHSANDKVLSPQQFATQPSTVRLLESYAAENKEQSDVEYIINRTNKKEEVGSLASLVTVGLGKPDPTIADELASIERGFIRGTFKSFDQREIAQRKVSEIADRYASDEAIGPWANRVLELMGTAP